MSTNENKFNNYEAMLVNKQVPASVLKMLSLGKGNRAFDTYRYGTLEIFIVLNNISQQKVREFNGDISVIYQDYKVPFIILKYKKMSFDIPLVNLIDIDIDKNMLSIFVVDENSYILKNIKLLGLNSELMENISNGYKNIASNSINQMMYTLHNEIYPKLSPNDMCKGGIRQRFLAES
jgi:hypothetical protein